MSNEDHDLKKECQAALILLRQLQELNRDDEEASIIDQETVDIVVESETLYVETAQKCVLRIMTAEALVEAIKGLKRYHSLRQKRLEAHIETMRRSLAETMLSLGKKTMELPSGTATAKRLPPKVVIDNEAAIDDRFKVMELKSEMVIDKLKLEDALKALAKLEEDETAEIPPEMMVSGARYVAEPKFSLNVRKT